MTKKQFHHDLRRGLGSCIAEMMNSRDIETYTDEVLWCCRHEMAYDSQCEGTRAWYMFQMIQLYEDWKPFNDALYETALKKISDRGSLFFQTVEVMSLMAGAGYELSMRCLDDVFNRLIEIMRKSRKRRKWGIYPEFDNYECICYVIFNNAYKNIEDKKKFFIKAVSALGYLCKENDRMVDSFEMDWFHFAVEDELGKDEADKLIQTHMEDEDVKRYYDNKVRLTGERDENRQRERAALKYKGEELKWQGKGIDPDYLTADKVYEIIKERKDLQKYLPPFLVIRWDRKDRSAETEKLVKYYETEDDSMTRYAILSFISRKQAAPFFTDNAIKRLIDDAENDMEQLSDQAINTLCYIKSDLVYDYARRLLEQCSVNVGAIDMFIRNYHEEDKEYVVSLVKSVPVRWNETDWHTIFCSVRDLYEDNKDKDIKLPDELLIYMYHEGFCATCREIYVILMEERGMLPDEIRMECRYDSNEDIRELMK